MICGALHETYCKSISENMLGGNCRGCLPELCGLILRHRQREMPCLVHIAAEKLIVASQSSNEPLGSNDTMLLLVMSYLHEQAAS